MKKIAIIVLALFFVLAIIDGVVQSTWAKEKALSLLKKSLQESGWDIQIGTIERAYPNIDVKDVIITSPDFALTFNTLKADLSLGRLWRKEIIFSKVIAGHVDWKIRSNSEEKTSVSSSSSSSFLLSIHDFSLTNATIFDHFIASISGSLTIKDSPKKGLQIQASGLVHPESENPILGTNWNFSGQVLHNRDRTWSLNKLKANSNLFQIKGQGNLNAQGKLNIASFEIQSDHFSLSDPVSISGQLLAHLEITQKQTDFIFHTTWRMPSFEILQNQISNVQGEIHSTYSVGTLENTASASAIYLNHKWNITAPFTWVQDTGFTFSNIEIDSPLIKAEGNLQIRPDKAITANGSFSSAQLHEFFPIFYGQASGKIDWQTIDHTPLLHFDTRITDAHYKDFSAKTVVLYSDLENPFAELNGSVVCDIEEGKWKNLKIDTASIETTKEGENWPFQITGIGKWEHPLELDLNGYWSLKQDNLVISLQNATGSFFNHPLLLPTPASFAMSPTIFRLSDFALQVADATISASIHRTNDFAEAKLNIKQLPLDFLSLNPLDVAIEGIFNLDVAVLEKGHDLKGDLSAKFENLEMRLLGQTDPLNANGKIDGHFSRDQLKIEGALSVRDAPLFNLDMKIPIHFEIWPFTAELFYDQDVFGRFYLAGRIEEFLDFFNLGTHRLEGSCLCDLKLTNTLENPHVYGQCDFSNGYYQNYFTGTELQNIQAHLQAEKNVLILTSLTAQDSQKKGSFNATGKIDLLPQKHFPFLFDATFSRFNCATFDLITTEADGAIQITGDLKQALAKGHLEVVESDINVPSRIPKTLPDLQVVYKHAIAPPFTFELPEANPFPLHLDLTVDAPDGIFISGRGLESEWKGKFHVEGTQTDIEPKGKIELIKGNFLFSGRTFKLTEGSLSFSGVPNAPPYLNLAASIQVKDVLVTAHLKGPLNNPQVTLQSSPPLPMGTIVSYLLFGQDLAEINSFQALQLASSIASIAGEGPGILEQTKKSLGVDRIQIITVPSSTAESGETIAVQVGKYVTEGVLVSYSQGAENSAGNISIEVEAKGGLSFILESDQADEQKQGKFTFRWAHTY